MASPPATTAEAIPKKVGSKGISMGLGARGSFNPKFVAAVAVGQGAEPGIGIGMSVGCRS